MTRVEENKETIKMVNDFLIEHDEMAYEDAVNFDLTRIAMILEDVSKSLAIIADSHMG